MPDEWKSAVGQRYHIHCFSEFPSNDPVESILQQLFPEDLHTARELLRPPLFATNSDFAHLSLPLK